MQATPNMTCLVVNHENTTWNYYRGRDRAFLLPTAIFRPGGAAALLSNRFEPSEYYSLFQCMRMPSACHCPN